MIGESLTALESCIELFRDHANPPSMNARSVCDQANRARLELRALREAAGISKPLGRSPVFPSDRLFTAACHAMAGMLAIPAGIQLGDEARGSEAKCAHWAVSQAEALLSELAKRAEQKP